MTLPEWLRSKYKKGSRYLDNRFGDLTKSMDDVMKANPMEEDFDDYQTLEDWIEHLEMHFAPKSVIITMKEAWKLYAKDEVWEAE